MVWCGVELNAGVKGLELQNETMDWMANRWSEAVAWYLHPLRVDGKL